VLHATYSGGSAYLRPPIRDRPHHPLRKIKSVATVPELDPAGVAALGARIAANVRRAVKVPEQALRDLLVSLFSEGHVLIEDNPGVGKTALARAIARSVDAEYARIQCTADLLPADVVGTNVFNQRETRFEFRPGPVFANVVLVDEINRASPKTQSGLLECMQERHVTVDVHTHELARPFIVIATQNPIEYEGTYPLPEAQLDRFMVRVALGYPSADDEADMLAVHAEGDRVLDLAPVASVGEVLAAQLAAGRVHASEALRRYVVAVLEQTRTDPRTELGASPRAGLMLLKAAKALAALEGRDHALPDDVQELAPSVLPHRLLLASDAAGSDRADVVRDALERVPAL
jgi:MoxR-like ATPase